MSLWKYTKRDGTKTDLVSEGFVPAGTVMKLANLNGHGYWYSTQPLISLPAGLETEYAQHLLQWYPPYVVSDHITALRSGGLQVYSDMGAPSAKWICNPREVEWEAFDGATYAEICRACLAESWDGVYSFRHDGGSPDAESAEGAVLAWERTYLLVRVLLRLGIIAGAPLFTAAGTYAARLQLNSYLPPGCVVVSSSATYLSKFASGVSGHYYVFARGPRKLAVNAIQLTTLGELTDFATAGNGAPLVAQAAISGQYFSPGAQVNSTSATYFSGAGYNVTGVCVHHIVNSAIVRTGQFDFSRSPTTGTFQAYPASLGSGSYVMREVTDYPPFIRGLMFRGPTEAVNDTSRDANYTANTIAGRKYGSALVPWGYVLGLSRAAMSHCFKDVQLVEGVYEASAYASVVHSSALADAIELAAGKSSQEVPTSVGQLRANPRLFFGWSSAARERWQLDPLYSLNLWGAAQDAGVNLGAEEFIKDDLDTTIVETKTFFQVNAMSNKIRDLGLLGSLVLPGEAGRHEVSPLGVLYFTDLTEGGGYPAFSDAGCTLLVETEDVVLAIAHRAILHYVGEAAVPAGQAGGAYEYWMDLVALHHCGVIYGNAAGSSGIQESHSDWLIGRCLDRYGFLWGPSAVTPESAMSVAATDAYKATETFRGLCCVPFGVSSFAAVK